MQGIVRSDLHDKNTFNGPNSLRSPLPSFSTITSPYLKVGSICGETGGVESGVSPEEDCEVNARVDRLSNDWCSVLGFVQEEITALAKSLRPESAVAIGWMGECVDE